MTTEPSAEITDEQRAEDLSVWLFGWKRPTPCAGPDERGDATWILLDVEEMDGRVVYHCTACGRRVGAEERGPHTVPADPTPVKLKSPLSTSGLIIAAMLSRNWQFRASPGFDVEFYRLGQSSVESFYGLTLVLAVVRAAHAVVLRERLAAGDPPYEHVGAV